ncbi:MAG: SGNH/GDSL hydrolase family protein [Thermoanaerobaculia bacterium]
MRTHAFRAALLFATGALFAAGSLRAQDQPFRKYVALGNSITAGIQGNCLVERHQRKTYPAIITRQLGITDFQLPLVGETRTVTNPARVCLGAVVAGGTITVGAVSQMTDPLNVALPRPYDNLGISGARAADLVDLRNPNPAGNNVNMSAALVLRNVAGSPFAGRNAVEEANMLTPDLVTLWIGNNDVLGAMLAGVAADGVTLTPRAAFNAKYNEVLTGLRATGRTLVVLNIPDVGALPFATTVPPVVVNPTTRQPVLIGGNPVPLLGSRPVGGCTTPPCPIPSDTLVTLQAIPLMSQGIGIPVALGGTGQPLPDGSFVPPGTLNAGVLLYADEVAAIRARTDELNSEIAAAASSNGAILVDTHAIFDEILAEGLHFGGIEIGADFLTGGLFSADGVHPNNIGHAIIADEIIQTLNEERDLEIPRPNIGEVLFTPDVPPTVATRVDPFEAWKSMLGAYPPADGIDVQLPTIQGKRPPSKGRGRVTP